jgi:predicted PurR-regulated permease PerM
VKFVQWRVAQYLLTLCSPKNMNNNQSRLNRWVALLVVTGISLYLCWKIVEPFVDVLFLGIALAIIFRPVHARLLVWTKNRDVLSAGLSTLFTLFVIAVPFTFVTLVLAKEFPIAVETLRGGLESLRTKWDAASAGDGWLRNLRETFHLDDALKPEKVKEAMGEFSGSILKSTISVVGGALGFVVKFVFLLFVMFFLFRDGPKLASKLLDTVPMERAQSLELAKRTEEVLGACVYGVLMVAAIQGTLGGITFWALGLPSPATWAVVMTLLCTLPIVGAWLVWLPAAIGLAINEEYAKAIILALVGQFLISTIDGFLRPILVGQRAKLHELVIFFSVLGGLKYFGILGILMGPLIMAISYSLLSALWKAPLPMNSKTLSTIQ